MYMPTLHIYYDREEVKNPRINSTRRYARRRRRIVKRLRWYVYRSYPEVAKIEYVKNDGKVSERVRILTKDGRVFFCHLYNTADTDIYAKIGKVISLHRDYKK